jgi:hypothetical protein
MWTVAQPTIIAIGPQRTIGLWRCIMARMADFFEILRDNMNSMSEREREISEDIEMMFDDLLIDPDFDSVGVLEPASNDFQMYRELRALPVAHR